MEIKEVDLYPELLGANKNIPIWVFRNGNIWIDEYVDGRGNRREERPVRVRILERSKEVSCSIGGCNYLVGCLVAKVFVENPNNYKYITHLDGDFKNNRADNLKWIAKRTRTPKFNYDKLRAMALNRLVAGYSCKEVAEMFKCSLKTIDKAVKLFKDDLEFEINRAKRLAKSRR